MVSERSSGSDREYGRTPPQDNVAEQSVLGGMMLSKDAIADVVEVLRPDDFYRPAHQTVYECILDLYGRGEPADAVTVSAELQRRGELIRLGGAPYLHTLIATVPTAANAAAAEGSRRKAARSQRSRSQANRSASLTVTTASTRAWVKPPTASSTIFGWSDTRWTPTPIGSVASPEGRFEIGGGGPGQLTTRLREALVAIQRGTAPDANGWLRPLDMS